MPATRFRQSSSLTESCLKSRGGARQYACRPFLAPLTPPTPALFSLFAFLFRRLFSDHWPLITEHCLLLSSPLCQNNSARLPQLLHSLVP